ncbi:hypothetical protein [Burkholderia cenocepacia]|uniref:hypothetical protein n=1 Tax=Burkholderia cenocepacia TaxID=95486 RepID=UPI002AB6D8C3|nr:hypothetical protein [Burkholderia cenocepacia]
MKILRRLFGLNRPHDPPSEPWPDVEDPLSETDLDRLARARALILEGLERRRAWARRTALERYGYTGPISIEQDAALSRDLSPDEAARLFPVHERQTHQG